MRDIIYLLRPTMCLLLLIVDQRMSCQFCNHQLYKLPHIFWLWYSNFLFSSLTINQWLLLTFTHTLLSWTVGFSPPNHGLSHPMGQQVKQANPLLHHLLHLRRKHDKLTHAECRPCAWFFHRWKSRCWPVLNVMAILKLSIVQVAGFKHLLATVAVAAVYGSHL